MTPGDVSARRARFAALHGDGCFVLPNAWDVGSAKLFVRAGAVAVATTSNGLAATLGRHDQQVTRDELVAHVAAVVSAVDVPVSVDAERLYAEGSAPLDEARRTVAMLAEVGAAGLSVEDYEPRGGIVELAASTELVGVAAEAAHAAGMTLTARAENHLYGVDDVEDTIARLRAYRAAGADVLYAPGPADPIVLRRICDALEGPVNVLLRPGGPTVTELAALGVRRVSTGGALAFVAYGAAVAAARELLGSGTTSFLAGVLPPDDRGAFDA